MTTSSHAAHRTRRALAGLGIVAASILLVAPAAGAERPGATSVADDEGTSGGSSAQSSAPIAAEPGPRPPAVSEDDGATAPSGRHEQALCHRTGSASDPYVLITVAFHTADGQVVSSDGGHERHDGPVFDPATMDEGDSWGDIIPPFTTADGAAYGGKNWPAGQATFENGCEPAPAAAPGTPTISDGDGRQQEQPGTPDVRRDEPSDAGDDPRDPQGALPDRQDDGARDEGEGARTSGRPGERTEPAAGAAVSGERALRTGGGTGDIAAVLGQQVTRDADRGTVVPASGSDPAIAAGLARTDSSFAILLMLGLSVLIGGYAAVDAIRERMRRTD